MMSPTTLDADTEAGLFLEITSIARRSVSKIVGAESARDIAQDIVLELLVRFRQDAATIDLARLPALVRRMARRRAFDQLRRADRRPRHDEDFMRELTESTHSWMEPDSAMHEEELAAFRERTLASLPPRCRMAYVMVREEGFSYGEAAAQLGITRRTVHKHVVVAQRRFRKELPRQGVAVASGARSGRQPRPGTRSGGARTEKLPRPWAGLMTWWLARAPPGVPFTFSRRTDADSAGQHVAVAPQRGRIPRQACRPARGNSPDRRQAAAQRRHRHPSVVRVQPVRRRVRLEGATQKHRALRRALIRDHMKPVARIAAADLPDTPELQPLKLPAGHPSAQRLAAAAYGMAETAARHREVFTSAALPADFDARLIAAADAMIGSIGERADSRLVRRVSTKGLKAGLAEGRKIVRVLDALVHSTLQDDPALLAGWDGAKRVQKVGGGRPPAESSTTPTSPASSSTTSPEHA